jgi:predicted N-formylglutamate amidohydrolase
MSSEERVFYTMKRSLVISCEHASYAIPKKYEPFFKEKKAQLKTHQGWDIGALTIFNALKKKALADFYLAANNSRLLVDLNRSLHHRELFSSMTRALPEKAKQVILDVYYHPYRNTLMEYLKACYNQGVSVLHLSIHTFTPNLNSKPRNNDVGLLYDPRRKQEKQLSEALKKAINMREKSFRVRMNFPYRGISDGFVSFIRKKYSEPHYVGIEIEVNQKHFDKNGKPLTTLVKVLTQALTKQIGETR